MSTLSPFSQLLPYPLLVDSTRNLGPLTVCFFLDQFPVLPSSPISALMLPSSVFASASASTSPLCPVSVASSSSSSSSSMSSCLPSPHFPSWPPCHPRPMSSNFDPSLICWDLFQIASPQVKSNPAHGPRQQYPNSSFDSIASYASAAKFGSKTSAQKATKKKPKNGPSRRYKTPSPQLLRTRRENANARERKRMCLLNRAYEELRAVLPSLGNGQRLTKFETLKTAHDYITILDGILKEEKVTAFPSRTKSNSDI